MAQSNTLALLLNEAKAEYDSPELVTLIEKAMSTAGEVDLAFSADLSLSECLEQVRAYVEDTLPSNANTIVNLYKAAQLAAKLPKVEPEVKATRAAKELAAEAGVDLGDVEGTGKDGTVTKADVTAFLDTPFEADEEV